jgi:acetyl-CoA C-acetyltransferase
MSLKGKSYVVGAYEHPTRHAPDKSVAQLHAECAAGALRDAGLNFSDVDGYFCAGDAPGGNPLRMADYLNLKLSWLDGTELGGCSYLAHIAHATAAIAAGKCSVALITLAGKPRSAGRATGTMPLVAGPDRTEAPWEQPYRSTITTLYAMAMQRHMHQFGTTLEQLAWIKVAASQHAQHNPNALLQKPLTLQEVMDAPVVAAPLRRLDCCVITDGGGALVLAAPDVAKRLSRPLVRVLGCGETVATNEGGYADLTRTGAQRSGALAFAEAGVGPSDIDYASVYDNFTIMVLMQLEDLGFCEKGQGGRFVADGNLISGVGKLPWNTDGGGLCNNHPENRGGITKAIEAVRQLRGEAHPAVQVRNCRLAMATGPGLVLGAAHNHATVIMERV